MLLLRRVNLAKFMAHIELFRHIVDLPGCALECGGFKGMSLLTWTKLIEVCFPGDTLKRVVGFDTFEGFVDLAQQDGAENVRRGKLPGGYNAAGFLPTPRARGREYTAGVD